MPRGCSARAGAIGDYMALYTGHLGQNFGPGVINFYSNSKIRPSSRIHTHEYGGVGVFILMSTEGSDYSRSIQVTVFRKRLGSYVRPKKCDIFEERDKSVTCADSVPAVAREATGASRTRLGGTQHMMLCATKHSEQM